MNYILRITLVSLMIWGAILRSNAQNTVQIKQVWKRQLSNNTGDEILNDMAVHPDGTVLVGGRYTGTSTANVGGQTLPIPGASDGFLVQYDKNGAANWASRFSNNNNESYFGVAYGANKKPFAVGGTNTGIANFSYANLLISSADAGTGTLTNNTSSNGININNFFCVTSDEAGMVYGGGWFNMTNASFFQFNFGRTPAVSLLGNGTQQAMIVKHNDDRTVRWVYGFGNTGSDQVREIIVSNGFIYAVGTFQGTVDFNSGAGTFNLTAPTGVDNGFLLKLDTAGTFINAWSLSSNSATNIMDVAINDAGHLFLAAYINGPTDVNLGAGTNTINSVGGEDALLIKMDTTGNLIWHRQFGNTGSERIHRLALNKNSDVYIGGYFTSASINLGHPTSNTLTNSSTTLTTNDAFLAGYDSSGNNLCAYRYGSNNANDNILALAFDTAQNLYVAGYFQGAIETEFAQGYSSVSTATGGYDAFVIKYNTVCPYLAKSLPVDPIVCSGKPIRIKVEVFGANLAYQWRFNGATINNGAKYAGVNTDSLSITNFQSTDSGAYHLSVSRNGCPTLNTDSMRARLNNGIIAVSPVLYYKFDGNLVDENGGVTTSPIAAGYNVDRFGNQAKAFDQNTGSNHIDIPNVSSANYTVSMWVYHTINTAQTLIWGGTTTRELQISGNKLGMFNGSTFVDFGYTVNSSTWYHIAYVKNGSRCIVYANGVKVYENPTLLASGVATVSHVAGSTISDGLLGRLDDLRIYNSALTAENIHTLYLMPQQVTGDKQLAKCENSNVVIQSKISGAQSYQWFKNGVALSNNALFAGVTTDSLTITNAQAAESGNYVLRATNDCVVLNSDTTKLFVGNMQLTQNLRGNFLFESNLVDATGNITATGTINYSNLTLYSNGQSASMLGAGGRTSISFPSITNDTLSVSMWFLGSSTSVARTLLCGNSGNARHLAINTSGKLGYITSAGTFVASTQTILANLWYHISITKVGNNQKIYVNGILVLNDNNSFLNSLAANALTRIGGASGSLEPALGYFDNVRIYNKELNPLEIEGLQKIFEVKTQPVSVTACNGIDNVFLRGIFENSDTTRYTLQWKKDGVPVSNGIKYTGVNAQTLWVSAVTAADTGNYILEAIPTGLSCLPRQTNVAKINLATTNTLTDSLRLHLRFSGTTTDESIFKRIPLAASNIAYANDIFSATTAAGTFNGTSSHVTIANVLPTTTRTFTVMAWFKANQATGGIISTANQIPGTAAATDHSSLLFIGTDNKLRGKIWNGNNVTMASAVAVNDNQWHHAALVATATEQFLYLDGVQVGSDITTSASVPSPNMIVGSVFGAWPNTIAGWNNYFQGSIDEVKIINRSLSANEISRSALNMGFGFAANQTIGVCNNTPTTLNSQAVGSGVTYQWYKNGVAVSNSANVSGANAAILNFAPATASDDGNYQCAISKNCYSIFSDTFKMGVFSTIPIISQPQSGNVCPGSTMVLAVRANGANLQYQWKKAGANLNNGGAITGATSDTLRVTNFSISDTGAYTVYIIDACNNNVTSSVANITNNTSVFPGANTTRVVYPLNMFVPLGSGLASIAALNGTALNTSGAANRFTKSNAATGFTRASSSRIQLPQNLFANGNPHFTVSVWFKTTTASTTMGLIGTASSLPPANPTTGWAPILYINNTGKLSGKFFDVNGTPSQSTALVTDGIWHQALLTGNGNSQALYLDGVLVGTSTGTYSTTSVPNTIIGASYSANNGWAGHTNGWQYFNGEMDDVRFYTSHFTANDVAAQFSRPDISTPAQPTITVCPGAASQHIVSEVNGNNLTYEWYKNTVKINGATNDTLTITNIQPNDSGFYYAKVFSGCNFITTDSTKLILNNIPVVTTNPLSQSSCSGGSVALTVVSSGAGLTYQWQKNGVNLSNGGNIAGVTSATLTVGSLTNADTMMYRCIVTNPCGSDTSSEAKISLGANLQILQQPISQSVCQNGTVTLYVRTNDPSANFTWQRNNLNIGSLNNDSLTMSLFSQGLTGNYRVIINSVCGIDTSANANLTMLASPQILTQPRASLSICGSNIVLSVTATGAGIGYQWMKNGVNIPNQNSATYINVNATVSDSGDYQVVVSGTCGSPITSSVSRVSTSQPVVITTQPISSLTICSGNNSYVNLSVVATGTILGYQWYKNGVAVNNQTNVTGATSSNFQFLNSTLGAGTYTCKVFNACDTATSTAAVFGYKPAPAFASSLESKTVCAGGNVSFKINTNNVTSYSWFINGTPLFDIPNKINGTSTDSITAIGVTAADIGGTSASIQVQVSNGCANQTLTSNSATLNVVNGIAINQQSDTLVTVCQNQPAIIYVNANTQATYVWKRNGVVVPNQTNDTLTLIASQLDNGIYTCELSSQCGNITSVPVRLNVLTLPNPVITNSGNTLSTGLFTSYQWFKAGVAIANATQQSYDASESGLYSVRVVNSTGCEATSSQFDFLFTGINDVFTNAKRVLVYPNPTEAMLTIETEQLLISSVATVMDVTGKMVAELPIQQQQVDVRALASGVYLLKVTTLNQESAFVRFTKQ